MFSGNYLHDYFVNKHDNTTVNNENRNFTSL